MSDLAAEPLTLRSLTERERGAALRSAAAKAARGLGRDASKSGRRVDCRGSVCDPRPRCRPPGTRPGLRGAVPVPPPAAPPAAAALIYVTSQPILPSVIDYYLDLLPGVIPSHARPRLFLVAALDGTPRPLTVKLLERPAADRAHPRAHPRPAPRTSCRTTPRSSSATSPCARHPDVRRRPEALPARDEERVPPPLRRGRRPHPLGVREPRTSSTTSIDADRSTATRKARVAEVIVKLNEGVSGEGNALVDLRELPEPGDRDERAAIEAPRAGRWSSSSPTCGSSKYVAKLAERGGVVEERIPGADFGARACSCASRRSASRAAVDARPAARRAERADVPRLPVPGRSPIRAGDHPRSGKSGRGSPRRASSVASRSTSSPCATTTDAWTPYAIEINLRKGGTTHPFLTLQFLTDGIYDPESGTLHRARGQEKHFVASDHVESPAYRGLTPDDLSTSSPATASTSTSRARPASSST